MDIFEQNITISLNTIVFIVLFLIFVSLILFLILKLKSKSSIEQDRTVTGFLGKKLASVLAVFLIGLTVIIGVLNINNFEVFNIEAKRNVKADIYTQLLYTEGNSSYISFRAVPMVEGKVWGEVDDYFDIYWSFVSNNNDSYYYIEKSKSVDNKSGLNDFIISGEYEILVTIVFEGKSYTFTKDSIF